MRIPRPYSHNFPLPSDLCEYRCHIRTTSHFPLPYANPMPLFAPLHLSSCLMRLPMPYSHTFPLPSDLCEYPCHIRTTSHFPLTYANPMTIFAPLRISF